MGFKVELVTDANVANRNVHLVIENPTAIVFEWYGDLVQAASVTRQWYFSPIQRQPAAVDGTEIIVPIAPDIFISGESSIYTSTTNR